MGKRGPREGDLVADVIRRWPATARVFIERGMACVGCAAAGVHEVREAAESYELDVTTLLDELREASAPAVRQTCGASATGGTSPLN